MRLMLFLKCQKIIEIKRKTISLFNLCVTTVLSQQVKRQVGGADLEKEASRRLNPVLGHYRYNKHEKQLHAQ